MYRCLVILLLSVSFLAQGQNGALDSPKPVAGRFLFGVQAGGGWAYEDESHLFNAMASLTVDYRITDNLFVQFAPGYSWLWK